MAVLPTTQELADHIRALALLPDSTSIFSVEITLRGGMIATPSSAACSIRLFMGEIPHELSEIAGVGKSFQQAFDHLILQIKKVYS